LKKLNKGNQQNKDQIKENEIPVAFSMSERDSEKSFNLNKSISNFGGVNFGDDQSSIH